MYRTLPSLSRRRTPCVVSVTRTVNSWSPSRSMSLARTPGVSDVQSLFVRRGVRVVRPDRRHVQDAEEAWPAGGRTRDEHHEECQTCEPGTQDDRTTLAMQGEMALLTGRSIESGGSDGLSPSANRPAGGHRPAQCPDAPPRAVRWRRGWDSNPRSLSTQRFSRAPPSTARPPLRCQDTSEDTRARAGQADRVRTCRRSPAAR